MAGPPLVLCVGLNPALDTTYTLPAFVPGRVHKVHDVRVRAGGKATNVARVVSLLGGRGLLVAPLGGDTGATFAADLSAGDAVRLVSVAASGPTRRSVAVVAGDSATVLNEAGAAMDAPTWAGVQAAVRAALEDGADPPAVLAVSGSVPPGAPAAAVGDLVREAAARGIPVVVDTDEVHLAEALDAGPGHVKPNRDELEALTGASGPDGVRVLRERYPRTTVVASDGPGGILWAGPDGCWRARPAEALAGNPTGAGDALVAALALGIATDRGPAEILARAVGASAAAVLDPVAGHLDPTDADRLTASATVTRTPEDQCP